MKFTIKALAIVLICSLCLYACHTSEPQRAAYKNFGANQLLEQTFIIDVTKNNTLKTANGTIIQIPGGSLESDKQNVKLVVKDALSITDIALARLTTTSGGKTLSSGGMLYINAAEGYDVKIRKPLKAFVPTEKYRADMQVFKGVVQQDSSIDWQTPQALPDDSLQNAIKQGEAIFKNNCASCHKIETDFKGPALLGVTYRRPKEWLEHYASGHLGFESDWYTACIKRKWGTERSGEFLLHLNRDIEAVLTYIKSETDRVAPNYSTTYKKTCCDSCEAAKQLMFFQEKRQSLIDDNEPFFQFNNRPVIDTAQIVLPSSGAPQTIKPKTKDYVDNVYKQAVYYSINIEAFGWYNIDKIIEGDPGVANSELFVKINVANQTDFNVVLLMPSYKINREGGKANDGLYAFDEKNGKLLLPQDARCVILAYAEKDGKILFGEADFISGLKQTINIHPELLEAADVKMKVEAIGLEDVKFEVEKSKNYNEIKSLDKLQDSIKKLLPKNCDCGWILGDGAPSTMPAAQVPLLE